MITLTFHAETEDDARTYIDALKWRGLVQEFDNYLRGQAKYQSNEGAAKVRDTLHYCIREEGLRLWE